jgi:hypothetical protein
MDRRSRSPWAASVWIGALLPALALLVLALWYLAGAARCAQQLIGKGD